MQTSRMRLGRRGILFTEQLLEHGQVAAVFGEKLTIFAVHEQRRDTGHFLFLLNLPATRRPEG